MRSPAFAFAALLTTAIACADGEDGRGPFEPPPPGNDQTGNIEVSLSVTGGSTDPDGCRISVDGDSEQVLQSGDAYVFSNLSAGGHTVTITEVVAQCVVAGDTARAVSVEARQTTRVAFTVDCAGPLPDHIAFDSRRDGNLEVYVMAADGSNPVNLTNNPNDDYLPAWSPDGTQLAFTRRQGETSQIYLMNSRGENVRRLTENTSGTDLQPAWSPLGDRIAFTRCNAAHFCTIYVIDADGSNMEPLVDSPTETQSSPTWSPDARWLAISVGSGRDSDIYLVPSTGGAPIKLIDNGGQDSNPDWSPDGTRIAFMSWGGHGNGLYTIGIDGSNQTMVVSGTCLQSPDWSPDGTRIAFQGVCGNQYDIHTVRPDGTGMVNLTNAPGWHDMSPDWSPIP